MWATPSTLAFPQNEFLWNYPAMQPASLLDLALFTHFLSWEVAAVLFIGFFYLLLHWKYSILMGKSGERFVKRKLLELDPAHYVILNDLMLPSNGSLKTTQIDHVVVSNFGIFVIETKSFSGWIFGNAYDKQWTQVLYRYKQRFYNPLHQNYAHLKAVESLIRPLFPDVPISGYIAFPSADKLQISGTDSVGYATEVVSKIQKLNAPVISDQEKEKIIEVLSAANIQDKQIRKTHISNARELKYTRGS